MTTSNSHKVVNRRQFFRVAAAAAGGLALAACGQSGGTAAGPTTAGGGEPAAPAGQTASIKWSTWGNPGELERFREYTTDFNEKNPNIKAELIAIPNSEYDAKMLTQLSGGTAPDAFYTGDSFISTLINNKTIVDLTELLKGANSKSKPDDFYEGLWGAAKSEDGKIWGVTVDCNPMVLWYNKKLLTDAGVSELPADAYKAGNWNWDTFEAACKAAVDAGKRGYVFEKWTAHVYSFVTGNGGKIYENNEYVGNKDAKAIEAYQFAYDNVQSKNWIYSGGLPEGQGSDAQFMSQSVAFVGAGRWLLPVFKKNAALEFDIVPWPTNTGNKIEPAVIPTAYMVQNAKTPNADATFTFLTNFVSKEGQVFRLTGGGNAVPSIKGADEVVSEGNLPTNWQALLDAREVGYALWATQTNIPGLSKDIEDTSDPLWLKGGDVQATLDKIAEIANGKLKA